MATRPPGAGPRRRARTPSQGPLAGPPAGFLWDEPPPVGRPPTARGRRWHAVVHDNRAIQLGKRDILTKRPAQGHSHNSTTNRSGNAGDAALGNPRRLCFQTSVLTTCGATARPRFGMGGRFGPLGCFKVSIGVAGCRKWAIVCVTFSRGTPCGARGEGKCI